MSREVLHFSICACHPCAGAMLIFSVIVPISKDDPRRESKLREVLPCYLALARIKALPMQVMLRIVCDRSKSPGAKPERGSGRACGALIHIYIYIYIYTCICIDIHMCVCIYIYI